MTNEPSASIWFVDSRRGHFYAQLMLSRFWTIFIFYFLSFFAFADAPLAPPEKEKVCSSDSIFCVEMDPQSNECTAYKNNSRKPIWKIKGWYRVAAVSDDGSTFFTGYDGINLIPTSDRTNKNLVMLSIYQNGKLIREYRLGELVKDLSKLEETSSHVYWGDYIGLDKEQNYVLKTVEGRTLKFSSKTGRMIN